MKPPLWQFLTNDLWAECFWTLRHSESWRYHTFWKGVLGLLQAPNACSSKVFWRYLNVIWCYHGVIPAWALRPSQVFYPPNKGKKKLLWDTGYLKNIYNPFLHVCVLFPKLGLILWFSTMVASCFPIVSSLRWWSFWCGWQEREPRKGHWGKIATSLALKKQEWWVESYFYKDKTAPKWVEISTSFFWCFGLAIWSVNGCW